MLFGPTVLQGAGPELPREAVIADGSVLCVELENFERILAAAEARDAEAVAAWLDAECLWSHDLHANARVRVLARGEGGVPSYPALRWARLRVSVRAGPALSSLIFYTLESSLRDP